MMDQSILDTLHLRQIRHVLALHFYQLIIARHIVEGICSEMIFPEFLRNRIFKILMEIEFLASEFH